MNPWSIQPRLSPDIGWRDLASVLGRQPHGDVSRSAIVGRAPPGTTAVIGLSVRTLFDALLSEIGDGAGPIAASAVNIESMAELIRSHGLPLRSVDISVETLSPEPESMAEAALGAVVVLTAHLFGTRSALSSVPPGPLVVEDCAQAFAGALRISPGADVALYSFGPIKTRTALGGAVALFRDPDLAARIEARLSSYPMRGNGWFLRRVAKFAALKLFSHPVVYGAVHRVLSRAFGNLDDRLGRMARGFDARQPLQTAIRYQPPARMLALLDRRLRQAAPSRAIAADLMRRLGEGYETPGARATTQQWWLCPVLTARPAALVERLARQGVDATRGATSLRVIGGGPAPNARRILDQVVYLPRPDTSWAARRIMRALAKSGGPGDNHGSITDADRLEPAR